MNPPRSMTRRNQGVLSRAARGEGIVCPKCKTYAPLGSSGNFVCTSCGCTVKRVPVGEPATTVEARGAKKRIPRAKTTSPAGNLGQRRSALLEAAEEQQAAPPAPAPAAEPAPVRLVEPPPLEVDEDDE